MGIDTLAEESAQHLGIALHALRAGGHGKLCKPLSEAVTHSKSYEEALCRIAEYVEAE